MQELLACTSYIDKCRVCLQESEVMHSLYRARSPGIRGGGWSRGAPVETLTSACGMRISGRDGGPELICSACLSELDAVCDFLRKCKLSERRLTTLLTSNDCKDAIEKVADASKPEDCAGYNSGAECSMAGKGKIKSKRKYKIEFNPFEDVSEMRWQEKEQAAVKGKVGQARGELEALTCDVCGRRMRSVGGLRAHLRLHTGERPHACHMCDKTFTKKDNLAVHIRRHTKQRAFSCEVCGAAQYTAHELRIHARKHTGARPHSCAVCGRTFTASNNLYIHQRTHTGEKPHGCQTCGKKFISSNILSIHRRIHTGEKPYVCPVCGKRFASNKLAAHARTHTGERPHACALCGRQFAARAALRTHMRRHTGHERLTCAQCGRHYAHTQSLNKHVRRHHPPPPPPPVHPPTPSVRTPPPSVHPTKANLETTPAPDLVTPEDVIESSHS